MGPSYYYGRWLVTLVPCLTIMDCCSQAVSLAFPAVVKVSSHTPVATVSHPSNAVSASCHVRPCLLFCADAALLELMTMTTHKHLHSVIQPAEVERRTGSRPERVPTHSIYTLCRLHIQPAEVERCTGSRPGRVPRVTPRVPARWSLMPIGHWTGRC